MDIASVTIFFLATALIVLRITTQSGWRDHSRPLFTRLGILNIFQITKLQMGELVCKHQNLNQNNFLSDIYDSYFTKISEAYRYCALSRLNQNLFIPRPRTNSGKFSDRFATADNWNK